MTVTLLSMRTCPLAEDRDQTGGRTATRTGVRAEAREPRGRTRKYSSAPGPPRQKGASLNLRAPGRPVSVQHGPRLRPSPARACMRSAHGGPLGTGHQGCAEETSRRCPLSLVLSAHEPVHFRPGPGDGAKPPQWA